MRIDINTTIKEDLSRLVFAIVGSNDKNEYWLMGLTDNICKAVAISKIKFTELPNYKITMFYKEENGNWFELDESGVYII